MARIAGLEGKKAPLVTRGLARVAKRKWGRVTEMMKITTHVPKVAAGWAAFEMWFDRSQIESADNEAPANANEQEAKKQARIAQTGEVSALALTQLDPQFDLALLLSVEAFKTENILQSQNAIYTVWNHNQNLRQFLQRHNDAVRSVAWSPNGQLASGSLDGSVIVWDIKSGNPSQILRAHTSGVLSVAWSPDGRLASGSSTKQLLYGTSKAENPTKSFRVIKTL